MEDLVEELVGDITDEYDPVVEKQAAVRGQLIVDGLTTLDDFAEQTGYVLEEGPYDTVAGFFMARLGQLPAVNDTLEVEVATTEDEDSRARLELRVTQLDGRRAAQFAIRPVDGKTPLAAGKAER
jgi:putative hemolysin